jgi:hypothetical protein
MHIYLLVEGPFMDCHYPKIKAVLRPISDQPVAGRQKSIPIPSLFSIIIVEKISNDILYRNENSRNLFYAFYVMEPESYTIYFLFQRKCIEFALKAKPIKRYIPVEKSQLKIWWFVTSPPFEYAIFSLIMINTVVLAMKVCFCYLDIHSSREFSFF